MDRTIEVKLTWSQDTDTWWYEVNAAVGNLASGNEGTMLAAYLEAQKAVIRHQESLERLRQVKQHLQIPRWLNGNSG